MLRDGIYIYIFFTIVIQGKLRGFFSDMLVISVYLAFAFYKLCKETS